jgi:poly(A) polymerase
MHATTTFRLPHPRVIDALARVFAGRGRRLYLVGGAARDALLGRPVRELDFTTDARPDEIKQLVRRSGVADIYTVGEKFGTIGAIFRGEGPGEPLHAEITTFRSERYQPYSRKPSVEFGDSLEGDLKRRDFTINAIAVEVTRPEAVLIDPHGGREDLDRRLIRAVGEPDERFSEDPLRLLRAVRFATQLDFRIEPPTAAAMRRNAAELGWIPKERTHPELRGILLAERVAEGIVMLCDFGLVDHLVPELLAMRGMHEDTARHKDVFEHTLRVVENVPAEETLRWAALLHDVAKPRTRTIENGEVHFHRHELVGAKMTRKILGNLKYSRELIEDVSHLVELHLRPNAYESDWTDGAVRRLMREAGPNLERLLLLSRADVTSRRTERRRAADRRVNELQARCEELQRQADVAKLTSPLDGNELMAMFGRPPGPWIKPIKDHLTELVIDGELAMPDTQRAAAAARRLYDELFGSEGSGR